LNTRDAMLEAILAEIEQRKDYLEGEKIDTIYFGGGTPSLLTMPETEKILNAISKHYSVNDKGIEITLEGNPDDLTSEKLRDLAAAGINRLSIGIQSFQQTDLLWLNRVHDARQSFACIENAQKAGFENITVDLIYGIPGQADAQWEQNLEQVKRFALPHFSAYALTVEPRTALHHMIATKKSASPDEEQAARHFTMMQEWAEQNNFLAYEISNYCRPGYFSRHNSAYWQEKKYIGVGPSAHSYNLASRQWNIANNAAYIRNIKTGQPFFESEILTTDQQYNEYILTSLRTMWGCSKTLILEKFGQQTLDYFKANISEHLKNNLVREKDNAIYLTMAGKLLADNITADLLIVDR
jgi:putative oxygen-independent coproporphyrinogen III oxidase